MPIYVYSGYDVASGANRKGKIEADNIKSAKLKIKQKFQVIVADIKEESTASKPKSSVLASLISRVPANDMAIMTRQFATLQDAQVPLDESVRALTQQSDNLILRNTLSAVREKISEGTSLADAAQTHSKIFNKLYVNMLRAGETSGTLDIVLKRLADYIEYQVSMKGKVMGAITYPLIMMSVSGGIIILLFVMVVPKLIKVFDNLKVTVPWYTKVCISISEIIQNYWYLLIAAIALIAFGFSKWKNSEKGKRKFDEIMLKLPLFGSIVLRLAVSQFTKTLSTLLGSGVPIITALDITKNVVSNSIIAEVIEDSKISVQEGQSLGLTIERSGKFPPLVTSMIQTGERTGRLEEMLSHVAIAYDAEAERKIASLISTIEPMMTIAMTGVIVLIMMALLVPMMSIMGQVR